MTTTRRRSLTLEQFLALPERKPALEYADGEVSQKVSPKGPHSAVEVEVALVIDRFARPARVARAFTETRTTFAGRSYVPDVVVYRWQRVPTTAAGEIADDFLLPPDIAIEIVSPGQSLTKLQNRCRWYVEHGVQIAVLIAPPRREVYRYHAVEGELTLTGDDHIDLRDVLPGLQFSVNALFAALRMN